MSLKKIFLVMSILRLVFSLSAQRITVNGSGASSVVDFAGAVFKTYDKANINYRATSSRGGIYQIVVKDTDFGGTDVFMNETHMRFADGNILHIPTCVLSTVLTYNVPGVNTSLRFNANILADIFLGKITNWNDRRLAELNPNITLPNLKITPIYRAGQSGSTYMFSDFLSKTNPEWASKIGTYMYLTLPAGESVRGNGGVRSAVNNTPGAIGYIDYTYAMNNRMIMATIQNRSGNFIYPSSESIRLSANIPIPPDAKIALVNTSEPRGYPITSFNWIVLPQEQNNGGKTAEKARAIFEVAQYVITEGQNYTAEINYVSLPEVARQRALEILRTVTYNGRTLY